MFSFQAPLNTPVTEDVFSILTEKYRIPVPMLPGKRLWYSLGIVMVGLDDIKKKKKGKKKYMDTNN